MMVKMIVENWHGKSHACSHTQGGMMPSQEASVPGFLVNSVTVEPHQLSHQAAVTQPVFR